MPNQWPSDLGRGRCWREARGPANQRTRGCLLAGRGKGRGLSVLTEGGRCEDPDRVRRAGDLGAGWGLGRVRAWVAAHRAGARARTRAVALLTELRDAVGRSEGPRTGLGRWPAPAWWRGRRGHCCHGNTCVRTGYLSLPPTPHRTCAHLKLPLCPPLPQMASIITGSPAGISAKITHFGSHMASPQPSYSSLPLPPAGWSADSARPGAT